MPKKGRPDLRSIAEKSVDELEGVSAQGPYATPLAERVAAARAVPVGALTPGQTRLLISQRQAPQYVVPRALELLEANLWTEATFYAGDLLKALLELDPAYWPPGREWTQKKNHVLEAAREGWYTLPADRRRDEIRQLLDERVKPSSF